MDLLPLLVSFGAFLLAATSLLILRDVRRELASIGEAAAKGVNVRKEVRELCDEMEVVLDKLYHQESRERMRKKRAEQPAPGEVVEEPVDPIAELIRLSSGVRS